MSTETTKVSFGLDLIFLLLFLFLRPITLMSTGITVLGFSLFELFAAGISYLLLIVLIINLRQIVFDHIALLLLLFIGYCIISLMWGSSMQRIARVVLPLVLIFSVRTFVLEQRHISALLGALCIGYILPIFLSFFSIVSGQDIGRTDIYSGLTSFSGVFQGPHTFAYAMLNFMFVYCLFKRFVKSPSAFVAISMRILLVISFFCLFKSGTRTAIIGSAIFWLIYSFSYEKKFRYAIFILCGIVAIFMSHNFQVIFWKTEQRDLNVATSGRIEVWKQNLELFQELPLYEQLLGKGLRKTVGLKDPKTKIWSSHNDYLELLMTMGILGLLLYVLLLWNLIWDLYRYNIDIRTKLLFGAILASIIAMNFGSNASIFRAENAQYFWFYMGLFYCVRDMQVYDEQYLQNSNAQLSNSVQKG